jgi:hypothetical protein
MASIPVVSVLRLIVGRNLFIPMTMADERMVRAMTEHESTETESDGLVTALSRKQLVCVLGFVGFVAVLTWARRRAGRH